MHTDDKEVEQSRYEARAQATLTGTSPNSIGPDGPESQLLPLRRPYSTFEAQIRRFVRPGSRSLDLCCGTGLYSLLAAQAGAEAFASDFAPSNLKIALFRAERRGLTLKTVVADAESLPFADSSFDVVTCAGSLSYVDLDRFLGEVKRVLAPHGTFVCVDSLNHNPFYRANRRLQLLRGRRTYSTIQRMPTMHTVRRLQQEFDERHLSFHGIGAFLIPLLKPFSSLEKSTKLMDYMDKHLVFMKQWAFKFVFSGSKSKEHI